MNTPKRILRRLQNETVNGTYVGNAHDLSKHVVSTLEHLAEQAEPQAVTSEAPCIRITKRPSEGVERLVQFPDGSSVEERGPDMDGTTMRYRYDRRGTADSMAGKWIEAELASHERAKAYVMESVAGAQDRADAAMAGKGPANIAGAAKRFGGPVERRRLVDPPQSAGVGPAIWETVKTDPPSPARPPGCRLVSDWGCDPVVHRMIGQGDRKVAVGHDVAEVIKQAWHVFGMFMSQQDWTYLQACQDQMEIATTQRDQAMIRATDAEAEVLRLGETNAALQQECAVLRGEMRIRAEADRGSASQRICELAEQRDGARAQVQARDVTLAECWGAAGGEPGEEPLEAVQRCAREREHARGSYAGIADTARGLRESLEIAQSALVSLRAEQGEIRVLVGPWLNTDTLAGVRRLRDDYRDIVHDRDRAVRQRDTAECEARDFNALVGDVQRALEVAGAPTDVEHSDLRSRVAWIISERNALAKRVADRESERDVLRERLKVAQDDATATRRRMASLGDQYNAERATRQGLERGAVATSTELAKAVQARTRLNEAIKQAHLAMDDAGVTRAHADILTDRVRVLIGQRDEARQDVEQMKRSRENVLASVVHWQGVAERRQRALEILTDAKPPVLTADETDLPPGLGLAARQHGFDVIVIDAHGLEVREARTAARRWVDSIRTTSELRAQEAENDAEFMRQELHRAQVAMRDALASRRSVDARGSRP